MCSRLCEFWAERQPPNIITAGLTVVERGTREFDQNSIGGTPLLGEIAGAMPRFGY